MTFQEWLKTEQGRLISFEHNTLKMLEETWNAARIDMTLNHDRRAERAEATLESEQENHRAIVSTMNRVAAERDATRAEVKRLRAALKPFAAAADVIPDRRPGSFGIWTSQAFIDGRQFETTLTIDDLRNARAALDAPVEK